MNERYESWLGISVEHVVPRSLTAAGYPKEWIEDLVNQVTCCRHCNEFLNQYRLAAPPPTTLEDFFDLRDRMFREKRQKALDRHRIERDWFRERTVRRKPTPMSQDTSAQRTEEVPHPIVVMRDLIDALKDRHTGKYRRLWEWLRSNSEIEVSLTFAQIEELLGFPLPPSCRRHAAHWMSYEGSAVARAIVDAGWKASQVDLSGEAVVLSRMRLG